MNSDLVLANISQYIQLHEEETKFLLSALIPRSFRAGELIVKSGDPARYISFVNSGYLMTYHTDEQGMDHVIQFAAEGWWSGDIYSLQQDVTSLYSTRGLSNGELLLLPNLAQRHLLENYSKFERYFRMVFQKALIRQQLRYLEGHSSSAEDRYLSFVKAYPSIVQEVPQKYIASYLGITPEFLSKVRKKLSDKKS
jgi:CRP-like cAMP-binding protein